MNSIPLKRFVKTTESHDLDRNWLKINQKNNQNHKKEQTNGVFAAKGQNKNCGVLNFPKMQRNIARISALAFKMGQVKKIKAFYYIKL